MNKLIYSETETEGVMEYSVTLVTGGTDPLTSQLTKTKIFPRQSDARIFYQFLLKKKKTLELLDYFWTQKPLSELLSQGQQIQHTVKRADGSFSTRIGVLEGDVIRHGCTYPSLNAFMVAHYKAENPLRTPGNGWKECEARVGNDWIKMSILRAIS